MGREITNLYYEMQAMLEEDFTSPKEKESDDEGYTKADYLKHRIREYFKANYKVMLVGVCYGMIAINFIYQLLCLLLAILHVDPNYLVSSPLIYIFWMGAPFVVWVLSTLYTFWNYHDRKIAGIVFGIVNFGLIVGHIFYHVWCGLLLPIFVRFPTNRDISISMVFNLTRFVFGVLTLLPVGFLLNMLLSNIHNEVTKTSLIKFKLGKKTDFRKDKEFRYDMNVVNYLETGAAYTIKEKDRFLHSLANGTTGTGKTSSLFTVAISLDLDKMVHNVTYQKKQLEEHLKKGTVTLEEHLRDDDFDIDKFKVLKGHKDILNNLKFKAPRAGITAMAPNSSFSDEIYELAKQKGVKINRLDPTLSIDGKQKEGFIGFNPLYINPNLSRLEWMMEVNSKAKLFADVTQSVYDASGSTDVYFASINKNITTNVTMLVLLTYPELHNGKQPTPATVQEILNDFKKAKVYREVLVAKYGKPNENGNPITEVGKANVGPFQTVLDVIDSEILGPGSETMFDQSRGLRVIVNSFLMNPLIRNALCNEKTLDLDVCLAKGEETVVNYALELGSDSIAFGLFFLLSFINAVMRRPGKEDTRLPHFFYIDELPVLLHPKIESCFSLFRQYRVAMFVAIQSLSQMQKSPSTSFLKDVLQGNCAHHFVFGRIGVEEMQLYEKLAGTENRITEMKGVTESSLTVDNPSMSFNTRESMKRENIIEGGDIRSLDFQEVFVVTVQDGSPVESFKGRVSFLPKYERVKVEKFKVNWNQYFKGLNDKAVIDEVDSNIEVKVAVPVVEYTPDFKENKKVLPIYNNENKEEVLTEEYVDAFKKKTSSDLYQKDKKPLIMFSAGQPLNNNKKPNEEDDKVPSDKRSQSTSYVVENDRGVSIDMGDLEDF